MSGRKPAQLPNHDPEKLSQFAKWFADAIVRKGVTYRDAAAAAGIDPGYLYKVFLSYESRYSENQRLGFDKVLALGEYFGDVLGALRASNYEIPKAQDDLLSWLDIPPFFRENPQELSKLLKQFEGLSPDEIREKVNLTAGMLELIRANEK